MIFFFWPPPLLLPLLLPLCCFFFFASLSSSQLMTTNTQMVSLSLSLFHVPLVSVSNFLFSAVTQPDTKPPIIRSPFISCPALSACCRHINCRLLCSDPPFAKTHAHLVIELLNSTFCVHCVCVWSVLQLQVKAGDN